VPSATVDDVVQEVFVVVHRRLSEFEARSSLKTWLYGIVLRVVREHRRTLRRRAPHMLSSVHSVELTHVPEQRGVAPDEAAANAEAARIVEQILDVLDEEKREVFVLAELEELSAPEIAEALGVKLNTVYSRLRVARQEFAAAAARHRAHDAWRSR